MNAGVSDAAAWPGMLRTAAACLAVPRAEQAAQRIRVHAEAGLASHLPVSDLAVASVSAAGLALAELIGDVQAVRVNRTACEAWFGGQLETVGWSPPPLWDPLSGSFPCRSGWIRLHGNAPRHRRALLRLLSCDAAPDAVAAAVAERHAVELETAIIESGGAAAALRSTAQWKASDAGAAAAAEPLIAMEPGAAATVPSRWSPQPGKPLAGLRVLDMTRVIAGPVATQVLAGLGAQVLRIDPPGWDEPGVAMLVMWDKRSARLDVREPADAVRLRELLAGADVLVHGYRGGVMESLGLGAEERTRIRPGLVEASVRAYGFTGPWRNRRGFDSLVQFATGVAQLGMLAEGTESPVSLPVQALDYATGWFIAAAVLRGLALRRHKRIGSSWQCSLARTALELTSRGISPAQRETKAPDLPARLRRQTPLGPVNLAATPLHLEGNERKKEAIGLRHHRLGIPLGAHEAHWLT